MSASIRNRNSRGEYHGYQQWHIFNQLAFRGNYNNDSRTGYAEWHNDMYERSYFYIQ